ncbi:hypothetical protein KQX54_016050 [Cotesia glomerata]|uniref:Uncharacterized protein n=1 Tax=Cotesia glomerata TaxID=32391 RepID=A0AAV7IE63_COTGL|nr:hypothetical protein KQX54_016050 [Cotesia glomerata]
MHSKDVVKTRNSLVLKFRFNFSMLKTTTKQRSSLISVESQAGPSHWALGVRSHSMQHRKLHSSGSSSDGQS